MLHLQLCEQKSGSVTQIESKPDITVQVLLYKYNNNERNKVTYNKNICVQMPVFKCYICKNPNWHKTGREHRNNKQIFYKCNM